MPAAVFSLEDARRIRDAVRWYETRASQPARAPWRHNTSLVPDDVQTTYVQITDNDPWPANDNRYWYSGYEVEWDDAGLAWTQKTGGLVFDKEGVTGPRLMNGCEANNPSSTSPPATMGNGVECGTSDGIGVALLPLRGNPIVPCWPVYDEGSVVAWMCSIPNAVDVTCPPPP